MKEIEFNLLTEPWVRVRRPDNTVQEVSLTDALLHAQDYVDLAGEMPTQDAAVLRLLLAVLYFCTAMLFQKFIHHPLPAMTRAALPLGPFLSIGFAALYCFGG